MWAIVTVKLGRKTGVVRTHPQPKVTGTCQVSTTCTDVNGEHHSFLARGNSIYDIEARAKEIYGHVTRVESIPYEKLMEFEESVRTK